MSRRPSTYGQRERRRCSYCEREIAIGKETRKLLAHLDKRGVPCRAGGTNAHHEINGK